MSDYRSFKLFSDTIFSKMTAIVTVIGLSIACYLIPAGLLLSVIFTSILSIIFFAGIVIENHDFEFSSSRIYIINKLKFWSREIYFDYKEIKSIAVDNRKRAFNESNMTITMINGEKNKYKFRNIKSQKFLDVQNFLLSKGVNFELLD